MARILYCAYLYFFVLPKCFGFYVLSGNPEHVVLGDNVTVTLTCVTDDSDNIVKWTRNDIPVADILDQCELINTDNTYNFTCDVDNKRYYLQIPPEAITDDIQNVSWRCFPFVGKGSNIWNLTLSVPVTTVAITPAGDNNKVDIIKGETQTFTCTTDSSRPAAWIQWYIGGQNVTNQATPQSPQQDGDKFISSSNLVYTGRDVDHNKVIFCETVNIEGRQKVKSTEKSLYIQVPVTTVTVTPIGDNNVVYIIEGEKQTFTCTTNSSRPAAWIQWYIGGQNVTIQATPQPRQQDGDKLISSSSLVYTGRDVDHNKVIFCEAVNIEGRQKVNSTKNKISIKVPVKTVTIIPAGDNNVVDIIKGETQTFTCTTDSSRPVAWIQWYIGGQNVTNQATPQPPQQDGDKFISSSSLMYTGRDVDHNKVIFCEAVNIEGRQKVKSTKKSLYIQDGPNQVIIKPSIQSYTLNETDNLNQIQCTADCRPVCTMIWRGPNLPAGTTSVLNLQNINRNQAGDYQCTATNDVSSKTSVVVNVAVQHGPIQIEISPPDNTYTVTETSSINQITCTADCNPSCTTTWTGPNVPAGSTSILHLQKIDRSQAGVYNCTAVNVISSLTLIKVNIIVIYGPRQVVIDPTTSNYTRNETLDRVGPINCTANCKPLCTSTWNGPNLPHGTTSVLNLPNINRNQTGNYQCTASNDVSSLISATVYVVVNYQPTISSISNDKVVNENDTTTITCTASSIPQSIIRWIFETKELQNKYDGNLTLNTVDCLSMGRYTCQAVNMLGGDNRSVEVTVKCSPRINRIEFIIPSMIAIKDKGILNITAHIIAFPKPEMYWQFGQNGSYVTVSSGITNNFNINRHSSNLVKSNLTEADFGNYSVYAYNGAGSTHYRLHSVAVVPAKRPNQPINVTCEGRINSVTVNWKSGFNGGKNQTFTVYYKKNDNDGNPEWTAFVTAYSDPGHNMYTSAEIQPLEAGASFGFQVHALNEYNYTVSETSYCNTSEAGISNESKDQSVIIGAGAGVGSAIAILLIIGVILFMIKRRRDGSPGQEKKLIKRRSSNKEDIPTYNEADDIDGLHANPMYMSAELRPNESASKKMETEKTDTGKKEKDFEMGSVYENAEDIANSRADALRVSEKATMNSKQRHKYQPKRNKDGLVYADLELSPGPSGKRLVIRGLENRNNYAIIDLTKTAEPLPSDSESENEKEKN